MLNTKNKYYTTLTLNSNRINENLDDIRNFICSHKDKVLKIDITALNLLDATRVATLGSTIQYINNPDSKINWIVNSPKVKEYTTSMSLGNSEFLLMENGKLKVESF